MPLAKNPAKTKSGRNVDPDDFYAAGQKRDVITTSSGRLIATGLGTIKMGARRRCQTCRGVGLVPSDGERVEIREPCPKCFVTKAPANKAKVAKAPANKARPVAKVKSRMTPRARTLAAKKAWKTRNANAIARAEEIRVAVRDADTQLLIDELVLRGYGVIANGGEENA